MGLISALSTWNTESKSRAKKEKILYSMTFNRRFLTMKASAFNATELLNSKVSALEEKTKNLTDEFDNLKETLKRLEAKFKEMYKDQQSLTEIQIKDKNELHAKFTEVSKSMISELEKVTRRCELTEDKAEGLRISTELTSTKFEECNSYIMKLERHLGQYKEDITRLDDIKAEKSTTESKYEILEDGIETLDRSMSIYDNRIKYLENFIDKYIPIQVQSLISDSVLKIVQNQEQTQRYKKYVREIMAHFHDKILHDEGVGNLEISMEILAEKAADISRKVNLKKLYNTNKQTSGGVSLNKLVVSDANGSSKNIDTIQSAGDSLLNPDVIIEKSEVDSISNSSARMTPNKKELDTISVTEVNPKTEHQSTLGKTSSQHFGKAFVKKDSQYCIEEFRREDSAIKKSEANNSNPYIEDMMEVEDVLFSLQNDYVHLEKKVEERIKDFSQTIESKITDLSKNIEFTNNQMNVYMQMIHQDLEKIKDKK